MLESPLDDLARLDRSAIDRGAEHVAVFDQPMTRIEKQDREDLVVEAGVQLGAQVLLDRRRRTELSTALHLLARDQVCGLRDLVRRRRRVIALIVTHH
ncbi:hypothetical protein LV28_12195 [Pandoraea pnomenusa]|uniref:Uncharacterized protein n=1 Tax=Pandoraea pnomenusa TaxID=93220 RepID=A0A378YP11_9BURK|nr:hypothetical protein LV28_12195 [Pandoraea pnomenusa]SUA78201.1 Uncharacterised protein [Pandoraea pnomenusa]